MYAVEAEGTAGGICIFWKDSISFQQVEFNKNLVAIKVFDALSDWLLVGFYGPPYFSKKRKAWENLMALLNSCNSPWVCIGDFNFTTSDNEMLSNSIKGGSSSINYLKELIYEFRAVHLGFSSNKYTWARGQWGSSASKRRLDRGTASISWR
nr:hypothetical protein CFP56_08366 [Quercus suber]